MDADLLQALTLEAADRPDAVIDLLLESDATLTDVLAAYAGTPPTFEDGLPQRVLAEWLARKVPPDARAVQVRDAKADTQRLFNLLLGVPEYVEYLFELTSSWVMRGGAISIDQNHSAVKKAGARAVAIVQRELKRRILSLFPEVTVRRYVEFYLDTLPNEEWQQLQDIGNLMRKIGMDPHDDTLVDKTASRIRYSQDVPAPRWIPPHPEEVARFTPANPASP